MRQPQQVATVVADGDGGGPAIAQGFGFAGGGHALDVVGGEAVALLHGAGVRQEVGWAER